MTRRQLRTAQTLFVQLGRIQAKLAKLANDTTGLHSRELLSAATFTEQAWQAFVTTADDTERVHG